MSCRLLPLLLLSACVSTSGARLTPREQAQVYLQRGDGKSALPLLAELRRKSPDDLDLARMTAEAHVKAGDSAAFLKSLEAQDTAVAHYQQGLVRFASSTDASDVALTHFRRAVQLDAAQPEYRYRLGVALLESEQFEPARGELEAAVAAAKDHAAWHLPLAMARYRTGDSTGAIASVRTAVTALLAPADVKQARALMEQVADPFATFPRAARPQLERAIQWLEVADVPQEAIVALEELLKDHPDEAVLHALLGLSYARLDDAGRAVDELKRAIELAPEDGKNHLYLAQLYEGRQRGKAAEEHYLKALERNPVLDEAWLKLGDLAFERQDYVSAREQYAIAASLLPGNAAARSRLSLAHQATGNWPAAIKELEAVLDKDPDNLEFALRLGVVQTERFAAARTDAEKTKAQTEAKKWLNKVLEAQPENALASRALARLKVR